jgi:hypothetical protein
MESTLATAAIAGCYANQSRGSITSWKIDPIRLVHEPGEASAGSYTLPYSLPLSLSRMVT